MILTIGRNNNSSGFTLAELLLSVVILSFGLVAIIGSYMTVANALEGSQNRLKAIEFLQDKLAILQQGIIEENYPEPSRGQVALNNRPATYTLEISNLPTFEEIDLNDKLSLVKLSLAWKERNIDKDASVSTYLKKKQQP